MTTGNILAPQNIPERGTEAQPELLDLAHMQICRSFSIVGQLGRCCVRPKPTFVFELQTNHRFQLCARSNLGSVASMRWTIRDTYSIQIRADRIDSRSPRR